MKWENRIQTIIMLFMGGAAGAVCFVHVHDFTVAHGQPSWVGWVNAVTIELMAIALGLELRRRRRIPGTKIAFVATAMMFFIFLSLVAQVATAEQSPAGWLVAAVPALGFLVLVKVALSRPVSDSKESKKDTGKQPIVTQPEVTNHSSPSDQQAPTARNNPHVPQTTQPVEPAATVPDWSAVFSTNGSR